VEAEKRFLALFVDVHIQVNNMTETVGLPDVISTPLGVLNKHEEGCYYVWKPFSELENLFGLLAGTQGINEVDILVPHFENVLRGEEIQKAPFMEPYMMEGGNIHYRAHDEMPSGYGVLSDTCGKEGTIFIAPCDSIFTTLSSLPEKLVEFLHEKLNPTQFGFGSQIGPIKPVQFEWPDEGSKVLANPEAEIPLVVLGRIRFVEGKWIALSGCPYGSRCGQN
jgi:hypothetical protein